MQEATNAAPAVEVSSYDILHHQQPDARVPQYSQNNPEATPEQLYQYHLFMHPQRPYSPSFYLSQHPESDKASSSSTSAIVETVLAIIGMVMMLIVGVLGYKQMNNDLEHNHLPDMSGFIVTLATIPIAVVVLTLLMKLAVRQTRNEEMELEGQIALADSCDDEENDLGSQSQQRVVRALFGSFWSRRESGEVPLLAIDQDLPPAYEERPTEAANGR